MSTAAAEQESNKASSRRLYEEVFERGNFDVADEILAPDILSHAGSEPPRTGTAGIKQQAALLRSAIPDLKSILQDQFSAEDRVCSRWLGTGTHTGQLNLPTGAVPPTGRSIAFSEIRIDRYEGGRIVESWFIPDRFGLWQQLGLIPGPTPTR